MLSTIGTLYCQVLFSHTIFLRSDGAATIYFTGHFVQLLFEGGYYLRAAFISLESPDINDVLDKVHTSETVTVARHCQ